MIKSVLLGQLGVGRFQPRLDLLRRVGSASTQALGQHGLGGRIEEDRHRLVEQALYVVRPPDVDLEEQVPAFVDRPPDLGPRRAV